MASVNRENGNLVRQSEVLDKDPVRYLSFDMDGCILNSNYLTSKDQERDLIHYNQELLDRVKEENQHFSSVVVFLGSNRQSWESDLHNANTIDSEGKGALPRGSAFPALEKIAGFLEVKIDRMLLADIFEELPFGTSYDRALKQLNGAYDSEHAAWKFDATKVLILYAQMHKAATDHPGDTIVFEFYDDRDDILDCLTIFFREHLEMIPSQVTLHLHQYHTDQDEPIIIYHPIEGKGTQDDDYEKKVIDLAKIAELQLEDDGSTYMLKSQLNVANQLQRLDSASILIKNFEGLSNAERSTYSMSAALSDSFYTLALSIHNRVATLTNNLSEYPERKNQALIHGHRFKKDVLVVAHTYFHSDKSESSKTFLKDTLSKAEANYNNEILGKDRTCIMAVARYVKMAIANICSLALGLLGIGVYLHKQHYQETGSFFFFSSTSSSESLHKLNKGLLAEIDKGQEEGSMPKSG